MAGLVMQASGNLVEVDILELSRFQCSGVGINWTGADDGRANRPEANTGNG